ncbi:MAG: hypothetical protein ABR610_15865 [Thermoanaerobaculia bacterium]|nr:hypothetical protein [Acidobacteriota bacterium]
MSATNRELKCRLEKSGHSRVVVFHDENGQEVLVLPAERLDPLALEKLESNEVRCAVAGPSPDGTSALQMTSHEGTLLFQQRVWIGSGTWSRILRAP